MQLDLDFQRGAEPPSGPRVFSVSELTRRVRALIEGGLGEVWVEGEISNLRRQASGHQYFTLKDASSQLSCVLFAGAAAQLRGVKLADGLRARAFGQLTVYEARGQYQMIVRLVQDHGAGALQEKFEALKRKLAAEGLFAPERKRVLPRFPSCVGLVTSPTGAAIRDFLHVLHRRHPGIRVVINPVRVQGRGAAAEIARAIGEFADPERFHLPAVDVIVVTRGGGSIEDLWEFNEEVVARAIAAASVPVVSAVGHEIDFTIADFVADVRAPTPSAAAEILAADRLEVLARLREQAARLVRCCRSRVELLAVRLGGLRQSALFREPERKVAELAQTLDHHSRALRDGAELAVERRSHTVERLAARLATQSPIRAIQDARHAGALLGRRMAEAAAATLAAKQSRFDRLEGMLRALDPRATLARGYTITTDPSGKPLRSARDAAAGDVLTTQFSDGQAESVVRKSPA